MVDVHATVHVGEGGRTALRFEMDDHLNVAQRLAKACTKSTPQPSNT